MTMPVIFTGRVQGQTSAGAAIATLLTVDLLADGSVRFVDPVVGPNASRVIELRDGDLAAFFQRIFTGAGGLATGQAIFGST